MVGWTLILTPMLEPCSIDLTDMSGACSTIRAICNILWWTFTWYFRIDITTYHYPDYWLRHRWSLSLLIEYSKWFRVYLNDQVSLLSLCVSRPGLGSLPRYLYFLCNSKFCLVMLLVVLLSSPLAFVLQL